MLKDGTRYLCYVEFEDGGKDFIVIYWDIPAALSDRWGIPGWCVSGGLKPRIKNILQYKDCSSIISIETK